MTRYIALDSLPGLLIRGAVHGCIGIALGLAIVAIVVGARA